MARSASADLAPAATHQRPLKKQRLDEEGNSAEVPVDLTLPKRPQSVGNASRLFRTALAASTAASTQTGPASLPKKPATFDSAEEFIAFAPDSDNDEQAGQDKITDRDERPRLDSRNGRGGGRKRTSDEMDPPERQSLRDRLGPVAGNRATPWTWNMDWKRYHDVPRMFHAEVKAFSDYLSPTDEEHETRRLTIQIIDRAIKRRWPDASVLPFGSFETKLYHPLGDIDLVIQSRKMELVNKKNVLFQLSDLLRREGVTEQVQVIAHARVPIIKFVTTYGQFAVDISINQENGLHSGRIVNGFLQQMPALRPLAMVVKTFLRERKAHEVFNGGLGSYSTVCLLVNFLQMHPKVRSGEIRAEENLGTMLIEFFELYGHLFNARDVGLSLRNGGSYYSKMARGWSDPRSPMLLSIEDPQDATNDVSRGSFAIHNVFRHFAGANEMLTSMAYQRSATLDAMRRGHHVRLDPSGSSDMSILGSLFGIDTETMDHRRGVRELYDSATLHEWLGIPKRQLAPRPPSIPPPALPVPTPPRDLSRLRAQVVVDEGEAEMAVSDSDVQVQSSSDSDRDTRYRRPVAKAKQGSKATTPARFSAYATSDEEGEAIGMNDDFVLNVQNVVKDDSENTSDSESARQSLSVAPVSKTGPVRVKIDRKRDFWAAKGTT